MKLLLILTLLAFSHLEVAAQSRKKSASAKKPGSSHVEKGKGTSVTQTSSNINPAIDSFKRSNRYSPGRPYDTIEVATSPLNSNDTLGQQTSGLVNDSIRNNPGMPLQPTIINGRTIIYNQGRGVPVSPSHEPNRADINQRPVNENSKNAVSEMNSSQVNVLNQNQMAPPPQNWSNNPAVDNRWGRNTVGESQWTPNSTVSSGFIRDFPTITDATWIRDVRDTLNYSARYKTGDYWTISTYNATGARVDTRTELPLTDIPRAVALYRAKQGGTVSIHQITRVERPSMPERHEVRLSNGRIVYVNSLGVEEGF